MWNIKQKCKRAKGHKFKALGVEFEIDEDDLYGRMRLERCDYCGIVLEIFREMDDYELPGEELHDEKILSVKTPDN